VRKIEKVRESSNKKMSIIGKSVSARKRFEIYLTKCSCSSLEDIQIIRYTWGGGGRDNVTK